MMINRRIRDEILGALDRYPVLSLTGPRQSGKTTLLKALFSEYRYVSLEDQDSRQFALEDPRGFLLDLGKRVIIDEAQYAPELFSYIQTIVDESGIMGGYILSGSQNFLLMESITQSLAGRVAIFKLLPFSIEELKSEDVLPDLYDLILKGSYPRLYQQDFESGEWYRDYVDTYLERDVRMLKNVHDLSLFRKLLRVCASHTGQIVNYSSLGDAVGVSHHTVRDWLSILETSYIVFFLQPFTTHASKREIKSPKLYFYDTGLVSSLLKLNSRESLLKSSYKGALFETLMISEYVKSCFNRRKEFPGYFWRYRNQYELDLVMDYHDRLDCVEMKSSATISSDFFKNLVYFSEYSADKTVNSYVVYAGDKMQRRSVGVVLPWMDGVV